MKLLNLNRLRPRASARSWKITDEWVTNGHIAIHRSRVDSNSIPITAEPVDQTCINRLLDQAPPFDSTTRYLRTPLLATDAFRLVRLYSHQPSGCWVGVDEAYNKALDLNALFGTIDAAPSLLFAKPSERLDAILAPVEINDLVTTYLARKEP